MKTYLVTLQRTIPLTTSVLVDAEDPESAVVAALEQAPDDSDWEIIYGPDDDVEIANCEEQTEC